MTRRIPREQYEDTPEVIAFMNEVGDCCFEHRAGDSDAAEVFLDCGFTNLGEVRAAVAHLPPSLTPAVWLMAHYPEDDWDARCPFAREWALAYVTFVHKHLCRCSANPATRAAESSDSDSSGGVPTTLEIWQDPWTTMHTERISLRGPRFGI